MHRAPRLLFRSRYAAGLAVRFAIGLSAGCSTTHETPRAAITERSDASLGPAAHTAATWVAAVASAGDPFTPRSFHSITRVGADKVVRAHAAA